MIYYIGLLWLAGGLLLHFLPDAVPGWAVFGGLVFLSGVILFAGQKTAVENNEEENGASEASSPPPPPSPSSSGWQELIVATVVLVAIAGGLLWWSPWDGKKVVTSITTGPPAGCPNCVEVPYSLLYGKTYVVSWQHVMDSGDTINFWGVQFSGRTPKEPYGFNTNSFTPKVVKAGTTLTVADGYNMPSPLYAEIIKK